MPDPEVVEEAAEPIEAPDVEPSEASEGDEEDAAPSLAEQINADNLDEVLSSPAVQAQIKQDQADAVTRARNLEIAEQRRQYANRDVVAQTAKSILSDVGVDADNYSRSADTKLNNLIAAQGAAVAGTLSKSFAESLVRQFELPGTLATSATELFDNNNPDGALNTLVEGAVAKLDAEREAAYEQRVKDEVDQRVKQELESARESGVPSLPTSSRGSRASNTATALTTAEIDALPYDSWSKLSDDTKEQIKAQASAANAERGAETVDRARLERVAALAT